MSTIDHIGNSADSVSFHLPSPWLAHPLRSLSDAQDVLDGCAATLTLLSDFFVEKTDHCNIFDSDTARYGAWLHLHGVAKTLEAVSAGIEAISAVRSKPSTEAPASSEVENEIAFSLNEREAATLDQVASVWGCSREEAANRLIVECVRGKFSEESRHDHQ